MSSHTNRKTSVMSGPYESAPPENEEALRDLRAQSAAFEKALTGADVAVFSQDRMLRYSMVSGRLFGRAPQDVIGRDDDALLPARSATAIVALKRDVLASGESRRAEICVEDGAALRWYDLHLQPVGRSGDVTGVGGVAVDITGRKEGEGHLRLLMRELTHRSKNLLAVIQAMARQTAQHTGSVGAFLDQFYGRLQALSSAHDLLVRESWHGASLRDLVHSQLEPYFTDHPAKPAIEGPSVTLRPEAAQGLGLALHELAANAVKHGALSTPAGSVSMTWALSPEGVTLTWAEQGGPPVQPRQKRGFGTLVIEHNLVRALDADVKWTFASGGVRCEIAIPASQLIPSR